MMLKILFVLVFGFAHGMEELGRVKRGASVYPVFGGANSGHMGAEQNSYLFLHDATPFIQYLGGSSGSSGHSGGGQASSYSFRVQAPPSGSGYGANALDSSNINSYNLHSSSQPSWSRSSSPSSGWQPSASGYGGSHYIPYFGLTTPNFANNGGPAPSSNRTPAPVHTLDATSLLHSAQSSFNSQTAVFNALTAGSRPRPYKGGSYK